MHRRTGISKEKSVHRLRTGSQYPPHCFDERHAPRHRGRNPENKEYVKFFSVKRTPVRGVQVTAKDDAIKKAKRYYGFFALITNHKMDAWNALDLYRMKDVVEKAFCDLKESLNLHRTLVSSEQSLDGKLFVEFVALIYLSYIHRRMLDQSLYKDYTLHEMFDKLDVIECFAYPGKDLVVGEVLEKQSELYEKLGFKPPAMP